MLRATLKRKGDQMSRIRLHIWDHEYGAFCETGINVDHIIAVTAIPEGFQEQNHSAKTDLGVILNTIEECWVCLEDIDEVEAIIHDATEFGIRRCSADMNKQ
jgi:hypothetical protein